MVSYLITLRWRRIVRLSSVISLTGASVTCRKRFIRRAKAPWSRQFAEGIGWRWGRLLQQPLPSLLSSCFFLAFRGFHILMSSKSPRCQPVMSTIHLFCLLLVLSLGNLLILYLAWLDSLSVCRNYLVSWNCLCCRCQLLPWKGEACTMSGRASPKSLH